MKHIIIIIVFFFSAYYIISKRRKVKTTAKYKGEEGEKEVSRILRKLPKKKYIVIDDIMLKSDSEAKSTQIDHIVISRHGIFVIETKNYNGAVAGAENSQYWHQYINNKSIKFRNPLKQNYAHIMALKKILNLKKECFISIVTFSDSCKLEIDDESREKTVNFKKLNKLIKSHKDVIVKEEELLIIKNTILTYNIYSAKVRKKHAIKVQNIIDNEKEIIDRCPVCGARLIKRKGRYGDFMGCCNYPKCKFTTDV